MKQVSMLNNKKTIKLDLKDKKIIFELDFNARMPYTSLAKKVGLSKQGAEYKLNTLIKKGVITGFYPIINVPRLGYIYCRLLITLQNTTKEKHKEVVDYLTQRHDVFWLFKMQGPYDILIVIWVKKLEEFKTFQEELNERFGNYLKKKTETVATDVIHYSHRYLLGKENTKEIHIKETSEEIELDDLDKKILSQLCDDARKNLIEIGKTVKQSAKVIAYRIKKLEKTKLIEGYRPIINHTKIGFTYYKVLIEINNASTSELKRVKACIKTNPLVVYIIEGIALPADLDIEMMVQSNQELFSFIEDLRFKFPTLIGEYQTVPFLATLKVKYFPF